MTNEWNKNWAKVAKAMIPSFILYEEINIWYGFGEKRVRIPMIKTFAQINFIKIT